MAGDVPSGVERVVFYGSNSRAGCRQRSARCVDEAGRGLESRRPRWLHGRVLEIARSCFLLQRHGDARLAGDARQVSHTLPDRREANGNARLPGTGNPHVRSGNRDGARAMALEDVRWKRVERDDVGHLSKAAGRLAYRPRSLVGRERLATCGTAC